MCRILPNIRSKDRNPIFHWPARALAGWQAISLLVSIEPLFHVRS